MCLRNSAFEVERVLQEQVPQKLYALEPPSERGDLVWSAATTLLNERTQSKYVPRRKIHVHRARDHQ